MTSRSITAALMRGGTSKGVFVHERDLPHAGTSRDAFILELLGSPDPMQIDGLGGTHSSTSKFMAVTQSEDPEIDVEYLFAQVAIDSPVVDYGGNCGNLTSAVGPFAIDEGLAGAAEPMTTVRMLNRNTGVRVNAHIPIEEGRPQERGEHRIAGVPNPGAEIVNEYIDPSGSVFGRALPTGNPIDMIDTKVGQIAVSFVDVTNPLVFIRAGDIGLPGHALPEQINSDRELLERFEAIRGACAVRLGLVDRVEEAAVVTPSIPKLALVAPPAAYTTSTGAPVAAADADLLGRIMSVQKMHHAFALTGIMCTAAAALLPGTVPEQLSTAHPSAGSVRIGHPKGLTSATVSLLAGGTYPTVQSTSVTRTARRLIRGEAYVRGAYVDA